MRCSPLHAVLSATGAEWGEKMGWERANWYNLSDEGKCFGLKIVLGLRLNTSQPRNLKKG